MESATENSQVTTHREPGRLVTAISACVVGAGVALAVLVGRDGSLPWQVARVAVVATVTASLVLAISRLSVRASGRVAVLAGVPALAVAVGFAPHWAKQGPLQVQVPAALLVVTGALLVVGGTVVATRGRGWWRRAGAGLVVVIATAVMTFVVGIPIAVTNVPRPEIGGDPSSVGIDHVDVALRTSDGVTLAAWYVSSSNRAAVVILHGAGSTRSAVLDHAVVLADAGFGVLMVDARGHGESGGRAMDFGWYGDTDIAAATAYLETRPDVDRDRIGAVGLSMGGEEAIGASGSDPLIRGVVAEGATARTSADQTWLGDRYGLRGAIQLQVGRVQDMFTDLLTSAPAPTPLREAVARSGSTRYLLITGGGVPDESHAAEHMASGAPDRVDVWTIPDAGHTAGIHVAQREWAERVASFLEESLLQHDP